MPNFNVDDWIKRYQAGEGYYNIARSEGISGPTVRKYLVRAGVAIRRGTATDESIAKAKRPKIATPDDQIVQMFQAGVSVKAISEQLGFDRGVINHRLRSRGIRPRNGSESMYLRMQQSTKEERQALTAAAHAAIRGKRYTFEELCQRAALRESRWSPTDLKSHEAVFYRMASEMGIRLIPQQAIGPYNVDFRVAEYPITVEIFGGGWHLTGRHAARFRQRSEYIRDAGLVAIILWCCPRKQLSWRCLRKIEALIGKFGGDEAVLREQYVAFGNGKLTTCGSAKLDYLTGVMRFHRRNGVWGVNNGVA